MITDKDQPGKHYLAFIALLVAMVVGASWVWGKTVARAQTSAPSQAPGRIIGSIKPGSAPGFHIWLSVPGTNKQVDDEDVDDRGKFLLEGIQPGIYQLNIRVFRPPFGDCGYYPWSKTITIHAGETVLVKAKIKVVRGARCE